MVAWSDEFVHADTARPRRAAAVAAGTTPSTIIASSPDLMNSPYATCMTMSSDRHTATVAMTAAALLPATMLEYAIRGTASSTSSVRSSRSRTNALHERTKGSTQMINAAISGSSARGRSPATGYSDTSVPDGAGVASVSRRLREISGGASAGPSYWMEAAMASASAATAPSSSFSEAFSSVGDAGFNRPSRSSSAAARARAVRQASASGRTNSARSRSDSAFVIACTSDSFREGGWTTI